MSSPSPAWFLRMRFSSPSPKATSRETETVPQVMPNRVRSVRTFCWRMSWSIWRRNDREVTRGLGGTDPLLDLLGRALDHQVLLLEALDHLDVHPVGEADLDLLLGGSGLAQPGQLDRGLAVGEGHEALRDEEHVLLLADRDVRLGGVSRAEDHVLGREELDLDVEQGGPLRGLRLGGDLRE